MTAPLELAYLRLREPVGIQWKRFGLKCRGENVDLSPERTLYGIELLTANAQSSFTRLRCWRFVVIDEVAGRRVAVPT